MPDFTPKSLYQQLPICHIEHVRRFDYTIVSTASRAGAVKL